MTINYRMGALGFMSLPDANVTGNYGLLDQQLAFKWVHRYISAYGGDPGQITLMGWSAGASSIGLHMMAESSKGLFQRAILMSGSPINPWAFNVDVSRCSEAMVNKWNLSHIPTDRLKFELQNLEATNFVTNDLRDLTPFQIFGITEFCFVPTIDNFLIPKSPDQLLLNLTADNAVPLLIGSTVAEFESDFPLGFSWGNTILPNNDSSIPQQIDEYLTKKLQTKTVESSESDDIEVQERRLKFLYDLRAIVDINFGVWKFAYLYGIRSGQPVYVYHFSFAGQFGRSGFNPRGASHGDDLGYIFGDISQRGLEINAETEQTVRSNMVQLWANFIKNG